MLKTLRFPRCQRQASSSSLSTKDACATAVSTCWALHQHATGPVSLTSCCCHMLRAGRCTSCTQGHNHNEKAGDRYICTVPPTGWCPTSNPSLRINNLYPVNITNTPVEVLALTCNPAVEYLGFRPTTFSRCTPALLAAPRAPCSPPEQFPPSSSSPAAAAAAAASCRRWSTSCTSRLEFDLITSGSTTGVGGAASISRNSSPPLPSPPSSPVPLTARLLASGTLPFQLVALLVAQLWLRLAAVLGARLLLCALCRMLLRGCCCPTCGGPGRSGEAWGRCGLEWREVGRGDAGLCEEGGGWPGREGERVTL